MTILNLKIQSKIQGDKENLEIKLRGNLSEGYILEIHDKIYNKFSDYTNNLNDKVNELLKTNFNNKPLEVTNQEKINNLIPIIRNMIASDVKERELQDKFIELEKLKGNFSLPIKEVQVLKPSGKNGRIDILLISENSKIKNKIIEMKRSSVKLISMKRGRKPSSALSKTVKQIKIYKFSEIKFHLIGENIIKETKLSEFDEQIIAGRRLSKLEDYSVITEIENKKPGLKIYSWVGWINEFERIYSL